MARFLLMMSLSLLLLSIRVKGHGMMLEPVQRSSLWRFPDRFPDAPPNYDDNQLFCGGAVVQHRQNDHKCGVCGDDYATPQPRPNEAGGKYGRGIIAATYQQGQVIDVTIKLTMNHYGYFVFKICPNNDVTSIVTQECLDKIVLQPVDGSGQLMGDRWPVTDHLNNEHHLRLQLPSYLMCSQCVLQWTYTAGNTWGCDASGHCGTGVGDQETFVNCADVTIAPAGAVVVMHQPLATQPSATATTTAHQRPTTTPEMTHHVATQVSQQGGRGCHDTTGSLSDDWCINNCAHGFCPQDFCACN